jgi:ketosteroid isomerase-like protein
MNHYEEIEGYGRRFATAYHAQDAEALHSLLDPDCILMNPGSPSVVGRDAVLAALTGHDSAPPMIEFPIDHYFESGDLIIVIGVVRLDGSTEPEHRYLVVYRRRPDGSLGLLVDVPIAGI